MCDKQATGRTQACRAPKFQPAVTVIISLPEKPSPSYTCMHRHARNTVTHPVSNNHNSHGSPRVLGMEAPDGRVRPPSGAAQRPQRRLHRRFPDAGDDDDETKSGTTRRTKRRASRRRGGREGPDKYTWGDGRTAAACREVVGCRQRISRKRRPVPVRRRHWPALGGKLGLFLFTRLLPTVFTE